MASRQRTGPPDGVLADIERLALRAPTRGLFFDEAAARLKRAIAFDGACWHTLDPGSGLITQHRLQDLPDRFTVLAHNEYAVDDVNHFTDLARSACKASSLGQATRGRPDVSPRFCDLLAPAGLGPELRGAFVADGAAWGAVILVRRAGAPDFDAREVDLLARASRLCAEAIRRGLVVEATRRAQDDASVGVIELDPRGGLARASSSADPLLAELSGTTPQAGLAAPAIAAVASAARAAPPGARMPSVTVKTPAGSWLVLHGGLMATRGDGEVAVFIQRAHPLLVAEQLLKAFALTPREQEVAQLVLHGATTAQAAQRLGISPHTVGDHLKAIFEKTGARTRGELTARLFFGEHLPRIQQHVGIGDDASFDDAPRRR